MMSIVDFDPITGEVFIPNTCAINRQGAGYITIKCAGVCNVSEKGWFKTYKTTKEALEDGWQNPIGTLWFCPKCTGVYNYGE